MKMTRDQLKSLVKECLIEILASGLGDQINEARRPSSAQRTQQPSMRSSAPAPQSRRPGLDSVAYGPVPPPALREAVREVAANPMMASIFADTANTTLASQGMSITNESHAPVSQAGDKAAKVMDSVTDVSDVFGADVTSRWVQAAFAPTRGPANQLATFASQLSSQDDYDV